MDKKRDFTINVVSEIDDDIVDTNLNKRSTLWSSKRKRKKKAWIPIVSIAASLILIFTSVFLLVPGGKQVPVYQGMTVSNDAPQVQAAVDRADGNTAWLYANRLGTPRLAITPFNLLSATADDPVHDNRDKEKHSDTSAPEASGGAYYAKPNEDIYILVHISNPGGYEILSFTLNGVKYSSYMFEPGSDLETLILKYNVGDVEGIQQYTIDAIKYVDGEKIKDVRMEGERTIEVLVGSSGQDVNLFPRFDGWDLIISPIWADDFTGEKTFLTLAVYDGETKLMDLDPSEKVFKDLPMDKRLVLAATYVKDGKTMTVKTVIQTPAQSEGLKIIDGVVTGIGTCTDTVLYINMPIGDNAFAGNKDITEVFLGSGVKSIGIRAFQSCEKLRNITFSKGLETIGSYAFSFCPLLKSLILPDGVTKIAAEVLWATENITTLVIPASVTVLGTNFDGGNQMSAGGVFGHIKDIRIYCEAERQPSGWFEGWNSCDVSSKITVYWGNDWSYVNGVPKPKSNRTPMKSDANRDPYHIEIDNADLTIISGPQSGNTNESYTKIFDRDVETKVCTTDLETPIIWSYDTPKRIVSYSLVGANDDSTFRTRVPVNFTLYGSVDGESWEIIDTQATDASLETYDPWFHNFQERNFKLSEGVTYQYFKLEIKQPFANLYQFSEIILYTQEEA
ncbi:MAG: leucine-rich repeat domain-containing protein [Clostridia bacterium]|nr:leucine-rich repeat domain-containing protein [Clostridia bacterium]